MASITNTEKQWDLDMPAYKRLRKNGLQPKSIDGAAELEKKAMTPHEVESGQVLTDTQRKSFDSVMKRGQEFKEAAGI